jgi:hypothetical protein
MNKICFRLSTHSSANKKRLRTIISVMVVLFFVSFAISSCEKCKLVNCEPFQQNSFTLSGFTMQEVNVIQWRKYRKGSNYGNLVETIELKNNVNGVVFSPEAVAPFQIFITSYSTTTSLIDTQYDYELFVPATNTLHRLSDVTSEQSQMEYCSPSLQKKGCISELKSCKFNGVIYEKFIPRFSK